MFRKIKQLVRPALNRFDYFAMGLCERWPYLSNVYYCFDRGFQNEHRAVLAGRRRYFGSIHSQSGSGHVYRLRRNTHRLEKGIISVPRRNVFARAYLEETIDSFEALYGKEPAGLGDPLFAWARSVLGEFFEITREGGDATIDRCREKYQQVLKIQTESPCDKKPQKRDTTPLKTTIEDMRELAIRRRSVRWYDSRPVPREVMDKAVEVAGLSPSACNRQPFEFRIFDDPKIISELADIPMGTRGFSHQFPVFIVIVGNLQAYPHSRDRHVIYIDASLAAMSLEFALEVQGVATCSINWPDIAERERMMAERLRLQPDQRVVMCMSAGYPDLEGLVPYSQKKSLDELRSYNRL